MPIYHHASEFGGLPVAAFDPEAGIVDPAGTIYRISIDYDDRETFEDRLARFLGDPNVGEVPGLVIGAWQGEDAETDSSPIVKRLVAARDSLPKLRALFLGDITGEENEISWIQQSDVTPLFAAFPRLEHFRVRGGSRLVIDAFRHGHLKSLVVESGGLDGSVVRGVAASDLPQLEHLELWTGDDQYGATVEVADLEPILMGERFPSLLRLGIRDCEIADQVARVLAEAPVVRRLEVLDLSLGNLSDEGAQELAKNPAMANLDLLDLHFHYVSDEVIRSLEDLGIELNAEDPQDGDEYNGEVHRYISVSE